MMRASGPSLTRAFVRWLFPINDVDYNWSKVFELSSSSQPVIVQQVIFGKRPDCPLPKSLNGKFDALPPIEVNKEFLY